MVNSAIVDSLIALTTEQEKRNAALLAQSSHFGARVESNVLPVTLDLAGGEFAASMDAAFGALEKDAARIAIESLARSTYRPHWRRVQLYRRC